MAFKELPTLPVPHHELVRHIAANPKTPMVELMKPYRQFEAELREAYAQEPNNPILDDPYLNVLPLFTNGTLEIKTRARDLDTEIQEERDRYIMSLPSNKRRPNGSPAVVTSLKEFKRNFGVFSESSLAEMDWNNVVAAGSSVVNTLLPVPEEFRKSKRALRQYYHEMFCPASDVDLFLYGLNEDQAIEKVKDIETRVRDAILSETTVVRTKNAITICSQYPTRHIQIVLRIYKSISEILTGFDIDSSGAAYDGQQVYVMPRALQSYITQINHIDLSRRSPSYENRLSKYSHRNFEIYWPELDRSRIDPTIDERSFQRTLGLARLLVLERLPTTTAREQYLQKRRQERGRPTLESRSERRLAGNIKDFHEDEVADWVDEDELSNYHTFTIPYGTMFHAKKIEKLCYTKDLLLNAEWNQPKERKVYLHRHPAFFGRCEDVIGDCCGTCPKPSTPEEIEIAERENEIYVSSNVSFKTNDPGRQRIGSFNPLTEDDWTEMAYLGNTARLCQAIVDCDLEHVEDWLSQEGADPNLRDYTGRTPLHLAVTSSTVQIVKSLVDRGARITARLADGQTALHLAASRGNCGMVKILLEKSNSNEEEEEDKQDQRRRAREAAHKDCPPGSLTVGAKTDDAQLDDNDGSGQSDGELVDYQASEGGILSITTGSFVKVENESADKLEEPALLDDNQSDPDFYKIDAVAWDSKCSPLHLAILRGHCDVVKILCQDFGADVLLPVKVEDGNGSQKNPPTAILSLILALALPVEKAVPMAETLLSLGATSSQADTNGVTAFHRYIRSGWSRLIETLLENDQIGLKAALNHVVVWSGRYRMPFEATTPLLTAVDGGDPILVLKLLEAGANTEIDYDAWLKSAMLFDYSNFLYDYKTNKEYWRGAVTQPLILAIQSANLKTAIDLLEKGADPNVLPKSSSHFIHVYSSRSSPKGQSALDLVRDDLKKLRRYQEEKARFNAPQNFPVPPRGLQGTDEFLHEYQEGTYQWWVVSQDIAEKVEAHERELAHFEKEKKRYEPKGVLKKTEAIREAIAQFEELEKVLQAKGAKTFTELYPDIEAPVEANNPVNTNSAVNTSDSAVKPPVVYKFDFSFRGARDFTDKRQAACVELFEAAWIGDLDKIKSITLMPFENNEPPLNIAVFDQDGNNPFSLALLRGHYAVAKAVLEIAQVQWAPKEQENVRYRMTRTDDDHDDSYESSSESGDEPKIYKDVIREQLTVDNVGAVATQMKSDVPPTRLINWCVSTFEMSEDGLIKRTKDDVRDLIQFAINKNDLKMFRFLIDVNVHYASKTPGGSQEIDSDDEDDAAETSRIYTFSKEKFCEACKLGRVDMLAEAIRRVGAGVPLKDLVAKSGLDRQVKSRYYQGLTVHGKKRADWARKGRDLVQRSDGGAGPPPLLVSALQGSLESVEWFCSDAPMRLYQEFGASKVLREDPRLKYLAQAPGGFDRVITKWLGVQNDLVIHCAVLGPLGERTSRLIEYLIKVFPASLETKSPDLGYTPLYLACLLGRVEFAKILIKAGADQSVKDKELNNLVHAALENINRINHNDTKKSDKGIKRLRELFDSLDPGLLPELFRQRNHLAHGGNTPLHQWLRCVKQEWFDQDNWDYRLDDGGDEHNSGAGRRGAGNETMTTDLKVLSLLLEYSRGAGLEMLNGAGDTALHCAVSRALPRHVHTILLHDPALLLRENAVGQTPAETAQTLAAALLLNTNSSQCLVAEPIAPLDPSSRRQVTLLLGRSPETFVNWDKKKGVFELGHARRLKSSAELVWEVVQEFLRKAGSTSGGARLKRRLISLNEANDVARRLGESYTGQRYFQQVKSADDRYNRLHAAGHHGDDDGDEDEGKPVDFLTPLIRAKERKAWNVDD